MDDDTCLNPDSVRLLLDHGANANAIDQDGETALGLAVSYGVNKSILYQLFAHGADPNRTNKHGETPLMLAQLYSPGFIALLKQYGAKDTGKRH